MCRLSWPHLLGETITTCFIINLRKVFLRDKSEDIFPPFFHSYYLGMKEWWKNVFCRAENANYFLVVFGNPDKNRWNVKLIWSIYCTQSQRKHQKNELFCGQYLAGKPNMVTTASILIFRPLNVSRLSQNTRACPQVVKEVSNSRASAPIPTGCIAFIYLQCNQRPSIPAACG